MRPHNKRYNGAPKRKRSRGSVGGPMQPLSRLPSFEDDATAYPPIPFGEHKNKPLNFVPRSYLLWLLGQEWFRDKYMRLTDQISAYVAVNRGRSR